MRVWSRDAKTARWTLSIYSVPEPTAAALESAVPNPEDKVRWWLVEDDRFSGHLYEFRNDEGVFVALNWPATEEAWGRA